MQEVGEKHITLNDGTVVPYGLLVWSTGVGPSRFVKSLPFEKAPQGRLAVDERLKVVSESAGRSFNMSVKSCTETKAWLSKAERILSRFWFASVSIGVILNFEIISGTLKSSVDQRGDSKVVRRTDVGT
jgi:hypothetical protein